MERRSRRRDALSIAVASPANALSLGRVYVYSADCHGLIPYGDGCPGAGFLPSLHIDGCPVPGSDFHVKVVDANGYGGLTHAIVFLGAQQASLPLPGGCCVLVQPILAASLLPVTGFGPGQGELEFAAKLPVSAAPGIVTIQAFVEGLFGAYSTTAAFAVHVH